MRRVLFGVVLAPVCLVVLAAALPARALVVAPTPVPMKVSQADVIVTGQVVGLEDRDVEATAQPGANQKIFYRIAVVNVADALKGNTQGKKLLRVGFRAPQAAAIPGGGVQGFAPPAGGLKPIRPFIGSFGGGSLSVGQDGLFYLKKHHEGDFFTLGNYFGSFVSSEQQQALDNEVGQVRAALKVLEDPMASLRSGKPEERLLAAAFLITKYRTPIGSIKTEPIDAEESKQILKALLDADWALNNYKFNAQLNPLALFNQLGVTENDGFKQPTAITSPQDYPNAVKAWLKQNWQTYRVRRFVPANPAGPQTGGPVQIRPLPPQQLKDFSTNPGE